MTISYAIVCKRCERSQHYSYQKASAAPEFTGTAKSMRQDCKDHGCRFVCEVMEVTLTPIDLLRVGLKDDEVIA